MLPSWYLRKPVMVAWSTPGAAVLATAGITGGYSMADAVGAFIACAALITLFGVTGWFERIMNRIPMAIASALLAGVLARFGLQAFTAAQTALPLVLLMLGTYVVTKRRVAAVCGGRMTLAGGCGAGVAAGAAEPGEPSSSMSHCRSSSRRSSAGVRWSAWRCRLFVVTMASQNLPGVAAIQAAGYGGAQGIPISKIITLTGVTTLLLAPFGAYALNLSAITAAICMGREAHEDPRKRYTAAMSCGVFYAVIGIFGATFTALLTAFPKELVAAIAGLALLGHDRQCPGGGAAGGAAPRGGSHHLPGHAQRRGDCGGGLGILGRGGRRHS